MSRPERTASRKSGGIRTPPWPGHPAHVLLDCDMPANPARISPCRKNEPPAKARSREGKKKTHAGARRRRGKRENPATSETTECYSIARSKSVQEHPSERLILCKTSIPGFAVPASMRCTCRRSISARPARSSWVNFRFCRMRQTFLPRATLGRNNTRTWWPPEGQTRAD